MESKVSLSSADPSAENSSTPHSARTHSDRGDSLRKPETHRIGNDHYLRQVKQLLADLQTYHSHTLNYQCDTQLLIQELNQSFSQQVSILHQLWDWDDKQPSHRLPSFTEWLATPEPSAASSADILSGVNALDTQILIQNGLQKCSSEEGHPTSKEDAESASTADESGLKKLLQNLLLNAGQSRELLEQLQRVYGRSHQIIEPQGGLLHQAEESLNHYRFQSLDHLLQQLLHLINELPLPPGLLVQLVLPDNDSEIWINEWVAEHLFEVLAHLLYQFIEIVKKALIHRPEDRLADSKDMAIAHYTITLRTALQGTNLMMEWLDTGIPRHHSAIGLDDVQSHLTFVSGTVMSVNPKLNRHLILEVPLVPMALQHLMCWVNDSLYALPRHQIDQVLYPKTEHLSMVTGGRLVLKWQLQQQEHLIRVYPLSQLIQYSAVREHVGAAHRKVSTVADQTLSDGSSATQHPSHQPYPPSSPVLLLQHQQQWIGIIVDAILSEEKVVVNPLDGAIASPDCVQGCCFASTHQLALVLDLVMLMHQAIGH